MKCQVSLELLVLTAAVAGVLVMWMPVVGNAQEALKETQGIQQQKQAWQQIVSLLKESEALGKGTVLRMTVSFSTATNLSVEEGMMRMEFGEGKRRSFEEGVRANTEPGSWEFDPGEWETEARNGEQRMKLIFRKRG
ncbi:hypothetical protein KJ765_05150 [Candidatus Micrarchaeota archaeon]|nr:hypothetical protein [Candidatus Micrarchaeota archaeon]